MSTTMPSTLRTASADRTRDQVARVVVGLSVAVGMLASRHAPGDWGFFSQMSKRLFGPDGLRVYGLHPNIQSGPLSLIAIRVLSIGPFDNEVCRWGVMAILGICAFDAIQRVRKLVRPQSPESLDYAVLIGGVITAFWWGYLKTFGHLDDAIVLTIFATSLADLHTGRRRRAAVMVGMALAVKPWAIFMVPMTFDRSDLPQRRLPRPILSLVIGSALWAPFLLSSRKTLDGMKPTVALAGDSVLRLFKFESSDFPAWLRMLQLGGAIAVGVAAVANHRVAGLLLGGVAVRLAFDPATWNYYSSGFILGALMWDLCESPRRVPWLTIVASCMLAPQWVVDDPDIRAGMRLAVCVLAICLVIWPRRNDPSYNRTCAVGRVETVPAVT